LRCHLGVLREFRGSNSDPPVPEKESWFHVVNELELELQAEMPRPARIV